MALAWRDGKRAELVASGAAAVHQAIKGVCVTNRLLGSEGVTLSLHPSMVERSGFEEKNGNRIPWVVTILKVIDITELRP